MDLPPPPDTDIASSLARRLRMLEEAHTNTRKKLELAETNMLSDTKKTKATVIDINIELESMAKQLRTLKDDVSKIIIELQRTAKQEQVLTLQKYLDMWQPMNFVTASQVRSIVKDVLEGNNRSPAPREQPQGIQGEPLIQNVKEEIEDLGIQSLPPMPDSSLSRKKKLDDLF